jgi:putative endonuclease
MTSEWRDFLYNLTARGAKAIKNWIPAFAGMTMTGFAGMTVWDMKEKLFYVYILASRRNGTLYIGVTSDLIKRVFEHKEGLIAGFTQRYGVKLLVYYEQHTTAESAIRREKQIKEWQRKWKLELIEKTNPEWRDLYDELVIPA